MFKKSFKTTQKSAAPTLAENSVKETYRQVI